MGVIHENFYNAFFMHKTLPLGYTRAETEDCKKFFVLQLQPKMAGIIHQWIIHQALQYLYLSDLLGLAYIQALM